MKAIVIGIVSGKVEFVTEELEIGTVEMGDRTDLEKGDIFMVEYNLEKEEWEIAG